MQISVNKLRARHPRIFQKDLTVVFQPPSHPPPSPSLYHSCSHSSFGFGIPTRQLMKFIRPFAYVLHMHAVPSVLVQPTPALVSTS